MHIALLTASASRLGGGVASAVQVHAKLLREAGARVTFVALEVAHSEEDRALLGPTPLVTVPVKGPAFFGYAPSLVGRLLELAPISCTCTASGCTHRAPRPNGRAAPAGPI